MHHRILTIAFIALPSLFSNAVASRTFSRSLHRPVIPILFQREYLIPFICTAYPESLAGSSLNKREPVCDKSNLCYPDGYSSCLSYCPVQPPSAALGCSIGCTGTCKNYCDECDTCGSG